MKENIPSIDQLCINAIRFLGIDAIEKANSGHPGIVMGAAPMGYVLWNRFLKFNPQNPAWFNRDRFVLSAGHGSMLQYALMHLFGYDSIGIEDIKQFRQKGSKTPGHPENAVTPGVEVTTGPLGQGFANGVGMALAEAHLAARFNKQDAPLVDHYTYIIMGDGCHMEGVSGEAASLAGHLGLGKLIALYDDNRISIDGSTDITFTEDVGKRFEAYGWHVQTIEHGDTDLDGIEKAIENARATSDKPSLIKVQTTIGYGAPQKADSAACHGAPLGAAEVSATREALNWTHGAFEMPKEVIDQCAKTAKNGQDAESRWNDLWETYKKKYPAAATTLHDMMTGRLPENWQAALPTFIKDHPKEATRSLSGKCINALATKIDSFIGGSADLAGSNKTTLKESPFIQKGAMNGHNIHFGVREHAMAAICNGIALHGSGLIPNCATFLSFADYMRPAIRLSALSKAGVIYVMTHDSIGVGEDGPTHQPVEQIASLRAISGLCVVRPADGKETAGAYAVAVAQRNRPTLLSLTRQKLPHLEGTDPKAVAKGAYVVVEGTGTPDEQLILIGTGSELNLCVEAAQVLKTEGINVRVVSMPSFDLFEQQPEAYRESVLPAAATRRLAVEAGSTFGWTRYVGDRGHVLGINGFGLSAPGNVCFETFGFTVDNVVKEAKKLL